MFGVPNIVFPKGTILDQVLEEYRSNPEPFEDQDEVERTLLICGSDSVGKTTLIQKVTDTPEELSPTVFIDYSFGVRKMKDDSAEIDVCNVWELASGAVFASLLKRVKVGTIVSVVLMVDLSQPKRLWHTIRPVLRAVKKYINSRPDAAEMKIKALDTMAKDHPDKPFFKPYCAPLIIIGGKYDIFQEFEPEQKRIICKCLRFIAHICCGYLVFYSDLHNDLTKLTLDVLFHYGYGADPPIKGVITEHTEPLHIPPGKDTLECIKRSSELQLNVLEDVPRILNSYFPQEDPWGTYLKNNRREHFQFREPIIDAYKREKEEELARQLQLMKTDEAGEEGEEEKEENEEEEGKRRMASAGPSFTSEDSSPEMEDPEEDEEEDDDEDSSDSEDEGKENGEKVEAKEDETGNDTDEAKAEETEEAAAENDPDDKEPPLETSRSSASSPSPIENTD